MIYKDSPHTIKDIDAKKGIVLHYWNAYGNEDSDGDIVDRGAFARSIRERGPGSAQNRIKFLWQHNWDEPRGVPLTLTEDETGLLSKTQITMNRPGRQGEDLLALMAAGVVTEHSVGMSHIQRSEADRRHIVEARLWEGSAVMWGSNPLTPVVDIKGVFGTADATNQLNALHTQILKAELALGLNISDDLGRDIERWKVLLTSYEGAIGKRSTSQESTNVSDAEEEEAVKNLLIQIQSMNRRLHNA